MCLVLLLLPGVSADAAVRKPASAALDLSIAANLDRNGAGRVVIDAETNLRERVSLAAALEDVRVTGPVAPIVSGDALQIRAFLTQRGFSRVRVKQTLEGDVEITSVSAHVDSVAPLALFGGELTLTEARGSMLLLEGTLGGTHPAAGADLSALSDVVVKLTVRFPGTIDRNGTDASAELSHAGNAVTWRRTADVLLSEGTHVSIRIIPDIEGHPWYWLALILVVTGLVVLGAFIVLQRGRDALRKRTDPS